MVHKVTGTICTMRPTIVACDVAGCRHHVASTLLWSTASETIRILDDLSLAVFFNSCDTRTKNINLLYLTPFPITSLHNLIHAVYLNFLYLPLFTAWRLCVDLATCLYFVLYRPMFIIIHCYLVLHHKYENKRYVHCRNWSVVSLTTNLPLFATPPLERLLRTSPRHRSAASSHHFDRYVLLWRRSWNWCRHFQTCSSRRILCRHGCRTGKLVSEYRQNC